MKEYPKVYIIILNYNSGNETMECIRSIKNITYPNYKIVMVDNHSNDSSRTTISENFPEETLISCDENRGYAAGNNIGIKYALEAGAEYICLLNSDVIVERDFLEPLIETLVSDSKIGMVGPCICDYYHRDIIQAMGANINLCTGLAMGKYKGKMFNEIKEESLKVDYLGGACFIFKKSVVDKIGLIPENYFLFYEETEFCLKAERAGFSLFCLPSSRVYHKRSATISKFKGLSYFFLNKNRIVFMRRNANFIQKLIFTVYIIIETFGRMLIRGESSKLFKIYITGLKADLNNMDIEEVEKMLF